MNIPIPNIENATANIKAKIDIKPKCDDIKCCMCNKTININIKYNKAKTFIRALTT
jgi:hypothetical protein